MLIDMSYEEATAIVEELVPGLLSEPGDWKRAGDALQLIADEYRLNAIRPACALATIWRQDFKYAGFILPHIETVGLVEYLISEPIWKRRYSRYYDEKRYLDEGQQGESA